MCPASCFTFSLQIINCPLLNFWYLWLGKLCLDISKKTVTLQKRALRLFCFSKSKELTVFLKSNYFPLPSLFFRDCSYLLYDINRQTAPVSILNQFVKTSQIYNYRTRSVSSEPIECMPFSRESVPKFGTLLLIRLKYLL